MRSQHLTRICQPAAHLACGSSLELDDAGYVHAIRVLHHRCGERLRIFDGRGHEFEGRITAAGRRCTVLLEQEVTPRPESPLQLELAQVLARHERMEFTLQKSTELGIARIHPLLSARCGVQLAAERLSRRRQSFMKTVQAACEQSGRAQLPPISEIMDFTAFIKRHTHARRLLLDPHSTTHLRDLPPPAGPLILIVGPEGGFEPRELELARSCGTEIISLGPRILRTETAALAALAALGALYGDL